MKQGLKNTNRVNRLIKEEYGISERLHSEIIPAFMKEFDSSVSKTKKNVNSDGVVTRDGSFRFDFFGDSNYILRVYWHIYYFETPEDSEQYVSTHRLPNYSDYGDRMLRLNIVYIKGRPSRNMMFDTVGHELEHLYQSILMGKEFGDGMVYALSKTYMTVSDDYHRYLAWIIYASTKSEQEAMVNGCYNEYLNDEEGNVLNLDKFIKESDAGIWLQNLYEAYYFVKSHNDEKMTLTIADYKRRAPQCTYKWFLRVGVNGIRTFERRIARLILKIKKGCFNHRMIMEAHGIDNLIEQVIFLK